MDLEKDKKMKIKFTAVKKLLRSFSFHKGQTKLLSTLPTTTETDTVLLSKSKSCSYVSKSKTPGGCFAVYVGPEKQRFVVKAKYANHPLFKMLLEDAELEYGFKSEGPILLPCDVQLFYRVLSEMDCCRSEIIHQSRCGNCSPFTPNRHKGKGGYYSAYALLTPSRLLKMNHS